MRAMAWTAVLALLLGGPGWAPAAGAPSGGKGDGKQAEQKAQREQWAGAKEKDMAKACAKMDKALDTKDVLAGKYKGEYSASLIATSSVAVFNVELKGVLEFAGDGEGGLKSVGGTMVYTFTGDAPNLPMPGVFDLNAEAKGTLKYLEGDAQAFTAAATGQGSGNLKAGIPGFTENDDYAISETGEDELTFHVDKADCFKASGTIVAAMFDQARDGFAAQGSKVTVTKQPTWEAKRQESDDLKRKVAAFQSTLKKQKLTKPDFTKIMAMLEVYERTFTKAEKVCALPVLLQWLHQVLNEWIPKAGKEADALIAKLAAADLDDKASKDEIKKNGKQLKKMLGELAVYRILGSFLGIEVHETAARNEAAAAVFRTLLTHHVKKAAFEQGLDVIAAARSLWLGDLCDLDITSIQIDAELADELRQGAEAFFAKVVADLQASGAAVDEAERDRLAHLIKKEATVSAALDGFPRALFRHCTTSGQC